MQMFNMRTTFNDWNYKYSCNLLKLKYTAVVMTPNLKNRKSGSIKKNKRDKKRILFNDVF